MYYPKLIECQTECHLNSEKIYIKDKECPNFKTNDSPPNISLSVERPQILYILLWTGGQSVGPAGTLDLSLRRTNINSLRTSDRGNRLINTIECARNTRLVQFNVRNAQNIGCKKTD